MSDHNSRFLIDAIPANFRQKASSSAAALLIWQAAAVLVHDDLLLASPLQVLRRLAQLCREPYFLLALLTSTAHVLTGFCTAMLLALLLALLSGRFPILETFLWPWVTVMRTTPVASFIILALIWLSPTSLTAFVAFLMAFPQIYSSTLAGYRSTAPALPQMARLFRIPFRQQLRGIYLPQIMPHLTAAGATALGMAWKAGTAAEVIALVPHSIGGALYRAKIYLMTADLFAWTLSLLLLSQVFGWLFQRLCAVWSAQMQRPGSMPAPGAASPAPLSGAPHSAAGEDPLLVLDDLSCRYGNQLLWRHVNLRLNRGDVIALTGPSGLGKTSLLNIIAGLLPADARMSGRITWSAPAAGSESHDPAPAQPAPGLIAFVFQEDRLQGTLTGLDNLRMIPMPAQNQNAAIAQLAAELGLSETDLAKPAAQLSGGMQRRLSLARAILADRPLLVMDEPFRGLDPATRRLAISAIRRHCAGKTILFATHDKEEAALLGGRILDLNIYR